MELCAAAMVDQRDSRPAETCAPKRPRLQYNAKHDVSRYSRGASPVNYVAASLWVVLCSLFHRYSGRFRGLGPPRCQVFKRCITLQTYWVQEGYMRVNLLTHFSDRRLHPYTNHFDQAV